MWKRVELHNHTNESDGKMTVRELASYFSGQGIRAFSLTDHNTVSGCPKLTSTCAALPFPMEFISGCELTTYYGHLLCQNVSSCIDWEDINETCPDPLFDRIHAAGGLAGPAHPFSLPAPFSNGMRWTMKIQDYGLVDFIEVINNAHPMAPDNEEAIFWWEDLIFSGFSVAPVTGMDFHTPVDRKNFYTTYIKVEKEDFGQPLSVQLDRAIRSCRTCVTKGPVLNWKRAQGGITLFFDRSTDENRLEVIPDCICQVRTKGQKAEFSMVNGSCFISCGQLPSPDDAAVFMVFEEITTMDRLIAIAPPLLRGVHHGPPPWES